MGIISTLRVFRSRVTQLIALGGVITTGACHDATGPQPITTARALAVPLAESAAGVDELSTLSSSLDDMTVWSLASLGDGKGRESIVGILNSLKGHLKSGKIEASQQDVTAARAFLESLSEQQRVEIGAVGVTLDLIQSALDRASK
jgi:hypothetical protein